MKIQTHNGSTKRLFELERQGAPSASLPRVNLNALQNKLPNDFRDRLRRKKTREKSISSFEYDFFSAKQAQKPENGQEVPEKGHPALSLCAFPDFGAEVKRLRFEVNLKTVLVFPSSRTDAKSRYKSSLMVRHVAWLERLFFKENKILEAVRARRSEEWLPSHSVEDLSLLFYLFFVVDEDQEYAELIAPAFFKTLKQILVHRPLLSHKVVEWTDFFVVGLCEKLGLLSLSSGKLSRSLFRLFQMLDSSGERGMVELTKRLSRPLVVMCGLFSDLWPELVTNKDFSKILDLFFKSSSPVETALYIFQFINNMHAPNAPGCHLPLTRRLVRFLFSRLPKKSMSQVSLLFVGFVEKASCLDCVFEFQAQMIGHAMGFDHEEINNFSEEPELLEPFPEFSSFEEVRRPRNSLFAASLCEVGELLELEMCSGSRTPSPSGASFFKNRLLKKSRKKTPKSVRKNGLCQDLYRILEKGGIESIMKEGSEGKTTRSDHGSLRDGGSVWKPERTEMCASQIILSFAVSACVKGLIPGSYCRVFLWQHFQKFYKPLEESGEKGEVKSPSEMKETNEKKPTLNIDAINDLYTFGGEQGMLLDNEKLVEQEIFDLAREIVETMRGQKKGRFLLVVYRVG